MAKGNKIKFDPKQLLLAKGEYVAMGVSGFFLALLLVWAASRWGSAKNPTEISGKLEDQAKAVHTRILNGDIDPSNPDHKVVDPPWVTTKQDFKPVYIWDFPITGPQFDPIAKPDTKRENPSVLPIGDYQVDLVRAPMKGYDIVYDNEGRAKIAVLTASKVGAQEKEKLKSISEKISKRGQTGAEKYKQLKQQQPPGGGLGQPPGLGSNPFGSATGGGFDPGGQRDTKVLEYVPLEELDKAIEAGKVPAMTVIPLRLVTIHAEIPYKQQVEEIKRALRLPTYLDAQKWGPIYDGYEIQRRVTRMLPGLKEPEVLENWGTEYKFEDKYIELINSRKLADHIEDGYLAHFIRYDMALALPLPQLVSELGSYPNIRLEAINKTIKSMKDANKPKAEQSKLLKQLQGEKAGLYKPQNSQETGASAIFGAGGGFAAEGGPRPPGGGQPGIGLPPKGGEPGNNQGVAPPTDIEHLLLRFVDVDVQPGRTYEYRVRLRMLNPNFKQTKEVANPAYATVEHLYSAWAQIDGSLTVPPESFLYAIDPVAFRKKIEDEYPAKDQRDLKERLQAKEHQVVVQMINWMEQIRLDPAGKQREPVGAWVVAEIPVGRGEYIGRKQYLKLPLWSSELNQYVLREAPPEALPTSKKDVKVNLPKGWLVDFTSRSILVDYEGGKVKTNLAGKDIVEDVEPELFIVRPDGKVLVKSVKRDEQDENRKKIVEGWDAWVKVVETRKGPTGSEETNPFLKKP